MNLLAAVLPRVRRLLPSGQGVVTLVSVGVVAGLEFWGYYAESDLHDALAASLLASAIAFVVVRHKREPVAWVSWLGNRLGRVDFGAYDHGYDLRVDPPYPSRLPPPVWVALGALTAWGLLAAAAWIAYPSGWRELGTRGSYVAYLALLLALWAGLAVCILVSLAVPFMLLDRRAGRRGRDRRRAELLLCLSYLSVVTVLGRQLPIAVVLGFCALVGLGALRAVVRGGPGEPALLWRAARRRPIHAVPFHRIAAGGIGLLAFAAFDLILTAAGGRLLSPIDKGDPMLLTMFLGTVAAWMVPGLALSVGLWLRFAARQDPAARTPPTVALHGERPAAEWAAATQAVRAWGWLVRRPQDEPAQGEVGVELVASERSDATEYDPRWPLRVSLDDLTSGRVKDRLLRRDEITLRRGATRGVRSLFKRAVSERRVRGGGYAFAPHWWFMPRMDRDEARRSRRDDAKPMRPVGPTFARLFGPRVRQHFHAVLRATQIDLIFVEDGVSHRSVERVLRAVFDLYDRHAGTRRAEEHVFRGLPKVRVVLHDYSPENPFDSDRYHEPQFEELMRARVLHVFRDHGDHEAPVDDPYDFSWEPSPALGLS